ncbi:MAG: DegT/DnrJ/EryC1/StrS family aminotransferase, partial [Gaiellaceae bacterium]
ARRHDLRVVEDAAPAIGAEWEGRKTGTFGDFAAFSFQGAKLVVTGEGGIVVTNHDDLYEELRLIWDQGRKPGTFWIDHFGLKYKMSNVQAAVGLGQLQHVEELVEAKRRIFGWYAEGLDGIEHVSLNHEVPGARSIYWMTSILLDDDLPVTRDGLIAGLHERQVDTRPVFPTISRYPIWERRRDEAQPVAARVAAGALNLPSGVLLRRKQVDYICRSIRGVLEGAQ